MRTEAEEWPMDRLSHENRRSSSDLLSSAELFTQFLSERRYLKNVTDDTLDWYDTARKAFKRAHSVPAPPVTKSSLQNFVMASRNRGVKAISVNTYIKALNAFCKWLHDEGHHTERLQLPLLKLEKRVVQTLKDDDMRKLLDRKPKTFDQWRLYALVALVLDTGVRIEEALTLRASNVDFDNLLLTVFGKGRKERRVPFSLEARKVLFRWDRIRVARCPRCELLFPSREGTTWNQRNSLRGLHILQERLRLPKFGWHRLRHTFATNYLRHGGDIVRLSMVLGHTQITTTQRYLHLLTEDLSASHQKVSILNRLA
jgi:integrase/recombinase XerD